MLIQNNLNYWVKNDYIVTNLDKGNEGLLNITAKMSYSCVL